MLSLILMLIVHCNSLILIAVIACDVSPDSNLISRLLTPLAGFIVGLPLDLQCVPMHELSLGALGMTWLGPLL